MTIAELAGMANTTKRMREHVNNVLSRNTYKPIHQWTNVSVASNCCFTLERMIADPCKAWAMHFGGWNEL